VKTLETVLSKAVMEGGRKQQTAELIFLKAREAF